MTRQPPRDAVLGVMYHYVRPEDPRRWGGIHPLSPQEFEEQLDALERAGRIVRPSDIATEPQGVGLRIVLTFDDGTVDHHEFAFPILRRRGHSALFAVMSGPHLEGYIPTMHLLHVLLSKLGDRCLWELLKGRGPVDRPADCEAADRVYHYEPDPLRRRVKYTLNQALPPDVARAFLLPLFEERIGEPSRFVSDWYMSEDHLREMAAAGMEFCVHAHRHRPYSGPPERFYEEELRPCEEWLARVVGRRPDQYVSAFGGTNAAGECILDCEATLRERSYRLAWLTAPGVNESPSFFMKRIDCAALPPRTSACF